MCSTETHAWVRPRRGGRIVWRMNHVLKIQQMIARLSGREWKIKPRIQECYKESNMFSSGWHQSLKSITLQHPLQKGFVSLRDNQNKCYLSLSAYHNISEKVTRCHKRVKAEFLITLQDNCRLFPTFGCCISLPVISYCFEEIVYKRSDTAKNTNV